MTPALNITNATGATATTAIADDRASIPRPPPQTPARQQQQHDLLIIGAGIHGLLLASTFLRASSLFSSHPPLTSPSPTSLSSPPSPSVLLLDSSASPGGVWSLPRLYAGLKTNNLLGSYEFSDFPLDGDRYGVKIREHIPGRVVGKYLEDFVREGGQQKGLEGCLRMGRRVVRVERLGNGDGEEGWKVVARVCERADGERVGDRQAGEARNGGEGVEEMFHTKCLAVCTGSTSLPNMPRFEGQDEFGQMVVHSADLSKALPQLLKARDSDKPNSKETDTATRLAGLNEHRKARHFVVIGGNKSAFDAAYALAMGLSDPSESTDDVATAPNNRVTILLRPSGGGPSWVWPRFITPFKLSVQRLATTRIFTLLDPTPWTRYTWVRWLLHCTILGWCLVGVWWWVITWFLLAGRTDGEEDAAGEVGKEQGKRRVRMFRPWTGLEWVGNSLSVDNYAGDFWSLVRSGRVSAVVGEVKQLGKDGLVELSDGTMLEDVQGIVCCTGWKTRPSFKWLPEGIERELGLPEAEHPKSVDDKFKEQGATERSDREALRQQLQAEIPMLRQPPTRHLPIPSSPTSISTSNTATTPATEEPIFQQPWRLYRNLIPISTTTASSLQPPHNIAFLGTQLSVTTTLVAQAQALWVTAYFLDHLNSNTPSSPQPNSTTNTTDPSPISASSQLLLPLPPTPTRRLTTLRDIEYQLLRHPSSAGGAGSRCADLVFDSLGYIDLLLGDLGMESRRKVAARRRRRRREQVGQGSDGDVDGDGDGDGEGLMRTIWEGVMEQWEELTSRYWPADYRGFVEEWVDGVQKRRRKGEGC